MLFGCPTRRAKHAKNSGVSDWMTDSFRDDDGQSQYSMGSLAAHRTRKAMVRQSYKAQLANEMTVTEGEIVHILHHAKNWAYVINSEGMKGYIPYSYCGNVNGANTTLPRQNTRGGPIARSSGGGGRNVKDGNIALMNGSQSAWDRSNDDQRLAMDDDDASLYSTALDMLDLADTISLRSTVDPEVGKRLGAGIYMADILPFFRVPYGRSVVLFDFKGAEENDLSVDRGTEITVLNQDDPGWIWVRTEDKKEGFVPRNYICPCGCTTIHEQIVESLQITMRKQEELQAAGAQRQQFARHQPAEQDIPEEDQDELLTYPEYDYARFQSGEVARSAQNEKTISGRGVQYSVQRETEAFDAKANNQQYANAKILPKAERVRSQSDESWGNSRSQSRGNNSDMKLLVTKDVEGPAEVDYLGVGVNDVVYISEENMTIGKGSGWLFVFSPELDRFGYVPENAVKLL